MKLITLFLSLVLVIVSIAACSSASPVNSNSPQNAEGGGDVAAIPPALIGTWTDSDSTLTASFTFNADGTYSYIAVASTKAACSAAPENAQSRGTFTVSGNSISFSESSGTVTCPNGQEQAENVISGRKTFALNAAAPNELQLDSFTYRK
jgi:hypothetical protein